MSNYTPKTTQTILDFSRATCIEAYRLHSVDGEGANTVAQYLGFTDYLTNTGNRLIDAGREIVTGPGSIRGQLALLEELGAKVEDTGEQPEFAKINGKWINYDSLDEAITQQHAKRHTISALLIAVAAVVVGVTV